LEATLAAEEAEGLPDLEAMEDNLEASEDKLWEMEAAAEEALAEALDAELLW
jgi:hypothetical protein